MYRTAVSVAVYNEYPSCVREIDYFPDVLTF